jgi:hypothetical protein
MDDGSEETIVRNRRDKMPKYRVDVTLEGYIEIEADSATEAKNHAEDGFSIDQFQCEDTEIGEIAQNA